MHKCSHTEKNKGKDREGEHRSNVTLEQHGRFPSDSATKRKFMTQCNGYLYVLIWRILFFGGGGHLPWTCFIAIIDFLGCVSQTADIIPDSNHRWLYLVLKAQNYKNQNIIFQYQMWWHPDFIVKTTRKQFLTSTKSLMVQVKISMVKSLETDF